MIERLKFDKWFFTISVLLVIAGILVFSSASMGLLSRDGPTFGSIFQSQLGLGLIGGLVIGFLLFRIPLIYIKRATPFVFIFALLLSFCVFIPGIGLSHGGAKRWIVIAGTSFQPSELLKIAYILFFAWWADAVRDRITTFKFGLIPFIVISGFIASVLLLQPDIGTLIIISTSGLAMYLIAGARIRHLGIIVLLGILLLSVVVIWKPYIKDRISTFLDPNRDPYGSSYQIQQSLIAIGSGGFNGRGFGQSIQKFSYLPEPIGDSIFAVLGEEFGFLGTVSTIILFILFGIFGLSIAIKSKNIFGRLTVVGIVILILTQSYMNIAAVLGIIPLTGEPLVFVSHGGSALLFALANVGLVLNVSRQNKLE